MRQPTVTAICLTADRQQLTDRAVQCFLQQTYENVSLLIYDTGDKPYTLDRLASGKIQQVRPDEGLRGSIGELRNGANTWAKELEGEILIHWDSDDWSAPHRIEDQVRLLLNSNADIVGFNDLLFWDSTKGQAWMYKHPKHTFPIGTSLCYWRAFWEKHPFDRTSAGEDFLFVQGQRTSACTSMQSYGEDPGSMQAWKPLLVAEVHGKNTYLKVTPENHEWKRESGWDVRLRTIMAPAGYYEAGNR